MKPSIQESTTRRPVGNAENLKWRVGVRVERELDGLWFPGTIVRCEDDGTFEIEYDEDQNRETDITEDELRLEVERKEDDPPRPQTAGARPLTAGGNKDALLRDSLLLQPSDYDPNKAPTVVLHHRGESHAGTLQSYLQRRLIVADLCVSLSFGLVAASAYIINGLENNIAAGNGLRGIRWLRVNTM